MTQPIVRALLAGLLAAGLPLAAAAQDKIGGEDPRSLEELIKFVENSSFIWLEEPDEDSGIEAMSLREFASRFEGSIFYDGLGGFLVPLSPADLHQRMRELRSDPEVDRTLPKVQMIEPNALVYGFASGCGQEQSLPTAQETPFGIDRINHLNGPISGPFESRVWIIDSGIAADFDGIELNVNREKSMTCNHVDCRQAANVDETATKDLIGHGTTLAGTIGAMDNQVGVVGVAPGAELIAVQIFRGMSPIISLATAYKALEHVADENDGAQSGDVVNISWGTEWHPNPLSDQRKLERELVKLANRGVKIAIAAGNNDVLQGSGYVQTVSPARAGAYRPSSGGAIVTVSAANSQEDQNTGDWIDVFWPDSVFGNGKMDISEDFYLGPPDFAAPGVDILSLWPGSGASGGMINTCTGTSFATAHMSGILVQGLPQRDGAAAQDPSAKDPITGQFDPARLDQIGVH